ncbi:MAG: PQQ-binding-like beta-propeller repeat protein, partial [Acidobacteriota bacterium]
MINRMDTSLPVESAPRQGAAAFVSLSVLARARAVSIVLAILFVLLTWQTTDAQEWTQWRGPERDGVVPSSSVPKAWPASLRRVWRVEMGEGYSSPVVSHGRVFVHSRLDPEEVVTAVDLAKGQILWQKKYAATFEKNQYAVSMAKGPNATPLIDGNRLFTIGVTGILTAWEAANGRQLWTNDYSKSVDTSKLFCGTATSPLMVGGLVVIQVGSDLKGGKIMALDPATGVAKWEWSGPGPGYASPIVIEVAGQRQLVALTEGTIVGLDPKTGTD